MGVLGESLATKDVVEQKFSAIKNRVCLAYGFGNEPKVDKARYKIYYGDKYPEPSKIHPTSDE